MTEPASVASDGMLKVVFCRVMGDPTSPGIHEVTAGTAVDLSCYFTDEGYNPSLDEQTVVDNRLCSRKTFQRPGRSQDSLDVVYVYNILEPADDLARINLTEQTTGFLVLRWGQDFEDAFEIADVVDVVPVICGVQMKGKPVSNQVLTISQKMFIPAPGVQRDVRITGS